MRQSVLGIVIASTVVASGWVAWKASAAKGHGPAVVTSADERGDDPSGRAGASSKAKRVTVAVPEAFRRWDKETGRGSVEAPFKLTASDGSGLALAGLDARAVVDGPLAFTELRMAFENPENRVIEGRFQITLPANASVSRFAMRIGDRWQEGEVVEKKRARRAYEDFLHRKQDPALLEQAAGNEFSARVFPIPAHGVKEIILSYSHEIDGDYTLPLRGLPSVGSIALRATDPSGRVLGERQAKSQVPAEDFVVHASDEAPSLRAGNLVVARVRPVVDTAPDVFDSTLVLVDTSASRALGFADQIALVSRLVGAMAESEDAGTRIGVACFDQEVESVFSGRAREWNTSGAKSKMEARGALGASNLEAALAWAKADAAKHGWRRVLVVSDGVATAGKTDAAALKDATLALASSGVERLDAVGAGGIRDAAILKMLVTAGLPRDGVVADAAGSFSTLGRKLASRTRSNVGVRVEGASWTYPTRLDGVQPGDEVLVYAEVNEGTRPVVVLDYPGAVGRGGKTETVSEKLELAWTQAPRELVERAWAKAKIGSLLATLADTKGRDDLANVERNIVALSTKHRVLSPYTSLLVLETEQDFARYDIDRRSLANILTVEDGRIKVAARAWDRKDAPVKDKAFRRGEETEAAKPSSREESASTRGGTQPPPPAQAMRPSAPTDGFSDRAKGGEGEMEAEKKAADPALGLSGLGEGGGGRGEGIGLGALGNAAPAGPRMAARPMAAAPAPEPVTDLPAESTAPAATGAAGFGRLAGSHATPPVAEPRPAPEARRQRQIMMDALAETSDGDTNAYGRAARDDRPHGAAPYTGTYKTVMDAIAQGKKPLALERASAWHAKDPGDVMALVALGEAYEANDEAPAAARAYGSLVDLFSSRADLRRFAGERLERLKLESATNLAVDSYEKAALDRPDHPSSHRLYAWALVKSGNYGKAVEVLEAALKRSYPRFEAADRILREDLGIVAAAWLASGGIERGALVKRLQSAGASIDSGPSLRFVLNWETDANDVDFHIFDSSGGHAFYSSRELPSGGSLYADITTGYGPECFTIRKAKYQRDPVYTLQAHYYSRGPMGYGMGKLQVIDHDGKGGLKVEDRPFVVMVDQAFVNLGTVKR
ncbi:MAG: VIT domain-containing protein [Polyangiaceae bacterium]